MVPGLQGLRLVLPWHDALQSVELSVLAGVSLALWLCKMYHLAMCDNRHLSLGRYGKLGGLGALEPWTMGGISSEGKAQG